MKNNKNYSKHQLFYENATNTMITIITILSAICIIGTTMLICVSCSDKTEKLVETTTETANTNYPVETIKSASSHVTTEVPETTMLETQVPETTIPETFAPETTVLETQAPETIISETIPDPVIHAGDIVTIKENAQYYSGREISSEVRAKRWIVRSVCGNRAIIDKCPDDDSSICSVIDTMFLINERTVATEVPETTVLETQAPETTNTYYDICGITIYDEYLPATYIYSRLYSDYDFEAEQLDYLYELCHYYDIDIKFVLAIIATESGFRSQAKNKYSSATGYGQVTQGTAEWVYENLLNRGDYDTSRHVELMRDWRLNMDIMMRLIKWLNDRYDTYQQTAMYYHGSTSYDTNVEYANKVSDNLTELFGITMADIER